MPVARFFPAMFAHVKGPAAGRPFALEAWRRRFVEEFSRVNGGGERIYKRGMLGVARGNGKSPLAAGLALRELVCADDEPDVILAAAARDQARVVFEYAALSSRGRFSTCCRWGATRSATRPTAACSEPCPRTGS